MLKIISFIFATIFSLSLYCQHIKAEDLQMVDTTKKWVNVQLMWGSVTHSEAIIFSGDTIISAVQYFKVFRSVDEAQELYELIGFARETPEKKVFFRLYSAEEEFLMYDFGANVNDTIVVAELFSSDDNLGIFFDENHPVIVTFIDTVYFAEQNRKRLHIHDGGDFWIEGIGSMKGLFKNEFLFVGYDNKLLCYYEDDYVLYQNPDFNSCIISTEIQSANIDMINDFIIYPNPSFNNFTIKILPFQQQNIQVSIYDITGKLLKTKTLISSETQIDTSEWSAGIYNCVIFVNGYFSRSQKVVLK